MDVEVGHSIVKYLTKLENLSARSCGMTEEMATIIAKRLPRLKGLWISDYMWYSKNSKSRLSQLFSNPNVISKSWYY
jgi:hypothetical protein